MKTLKQLWTELRRLVASVGNLASALDGAADAIRERADEAKAAAVRLPASHHAEANGTAPAEARKRSSRAGRKP